MGNLSAHFDISEFACDCGCGGANPHPQLIEKLEQLHKNMNAKAIYINSGFRCASRSVAIGGYANDMHVLNGAADIRVQRKDGNFYTAEAIAREAEKVGFSGIGMMPPNSVHVDVRGTIPYANNHWFGNESTGENFIETFADMGEPVYYEDETKVSPISDNVEVTIIHNGKTYKGTIGEV